MAALPKHRRKANESGSSTVEFVTVMPFFMIIALLVMEVTLALYWWKAAEKAAYIGARAAIVSDPVVTGLPATNALNSSKNASATYGAPCNTDPNGPCTGFTTLTCTAGTTGCSATAFNSVLTAMQSLFGVIKASQVTITYQYIGLGFAGGPVAPLITVKLTGIPFQTGFVGIVGNLIGDKGHPLVTLPDMTSALTSEDLMTNGG